MKLIEASLGSKKAISEMAMIALFVIIVIVVAGATAVGYNMGSSVNQGQSNSSELNSLQSQVNSLQTKLSTLPVMNQTPIIRNVKVEWTNTVNSGQDRFFLPTITVNQGDTVVYHFREQRYRCPHVYSRISIQLPDQCNGSWNAQLLGSRSSIHN